MATGGDAIILIGFMGAGKSCTGVELCRRTGLAAYDTDAIVVRKMTSSIEDIFDNLGEDIFREQETAALREIPRRPAVVITGGGAVLREENIEVMRQLGTIVWLQADAETIFRRIGHREDRPLLRGGNARARIAELLRAREELYREAAEIMVETSTKSPAEVAESILAELGFASKAGVAEAGWLR
ncbi:MAG TPA: shikimate kinase [Chthoniobacterales bacterium]|nr:shikimate kinase [Chthoniobacterales bacterium]